MTDKQREVDEIIEGLDEQHLAEMSSTEIEEVVKALSPEGMALRATRRAIRYSLYRCRTEAEGKGASGCDDLFKATFENQPFFGGWRMFGTTWDVAFDNPERIVHKQLSEQEEWNELVAAKFPTIAGDGSGRVSYPDINVRRKVEAEAERQAAANES